MRRRLHYRSRSRCSSHNHNRKWPGREEPRRERVFEKPLPRTVRPCRAYWGLTSGTKSRVPLPECMVCDLALSELPLLPAFLQLSNSRTRTITYRKGNTTISFSAPTDLALSVPRLFTCSSGLARPFSRRFSV